MHIRVFPGVKDVINEICKKHEDIYENRSHFVRCAISKYLQDKFDIQQKIIMKDTKVVE